MSKSKYGKIGTFSISVCDGNPSLLWLLQLCLGYTATWRSGEKWENRSGLLNAHLLEAGRIWCKSPMPIRPLTVYQLLLAEKLQPALLLILLQSKVLSIIGRSCGRPLRVSCKFREMRGKMCYSCSKCNNIRARTFPIFNVHLSAQSGVFLIWTLWKVSYGVSHSYEYVLS